LARKFSQGTQPEKLVSQVTPAEEGTLSPLAKPPVSKHVRLVSVHPHYFRGFRIVPEPVRFSADLTVVEGRNSSGKTSLSEALEWALTGALSRRASGRFGHPRELANCVTNEFRPSGQSTWVEVVLEIDGSPATIRRVLIEDYSTALESVPKSKLLVNGTEQSDAEGVLFLNQVFGGVHPILMQHNLRQFVHDNPTDRRRYFECLLQVDQLTALIERAVVGDARLREYRLEGSFGALDRLNELRVSLTNADARDAIDAMPKMSLETPTKTLREVLSNVARAEFRELPLSTASFEQTKELLSSAQADARQKQLPLLESLRLPNRDSPPATIALESLVNSFVESRESLGLAETSAEAIEGASLTIAKALDEFEAAGLVNSTLKANQICPLCMDPDKTLTPERLVAVHSWTPLAQALSNARSRFETARLDLQRAVETLSQNFNSLLPRPPSEKAFQSQVSHLGKEVREPATTTYQAAIRVARAGHDLMASLGRMRTTTQSASASHDAMKEIGEEYEALDLQRSRLSHELLAYRELVGQLESIVGASVKVDAAYLQRERWLAAAQVMPSLAEELRWQRALKEAQATLAEIRSALIALRIEIIEDARRHFSKRMTEVWESLRSDSGARFSALRIPEARGKGYKLELEVKAVISDGSGEREVDALRVFSESQVNVIGIAAYVTRAALLGHKVLIFDDPVQSMDEEHYSSFAAKLLPTLLDGGHQVLVLTHSDSFARSLSHHHYQRVAYVTLETRYSRRKGCVIDEGNRRVAERLKLAEKLGDDGDLKSAWRFVRLAIERMYTLTRKRTDETFDPETWRNASAEDMWNQGAGALIEGTVQGSGKRLKKILELAVSGAHDKAATSQTDLNDAIQYLRMLLTPLRIGNG
jgi:DNA repair exonuclease SbcCD ATPase subunit